MIQDMMRDEMIKWVQSADLKQKAIYKYLYMMMITVRLYFIIGVRQNAVRKGFKGWMNDA